MDTTLTLHKSFLDIQQPHETNGQPQGQYLGATALRAIQLLKPQVQSQTTLSNISPTPGVGDTATSALQGASVTDNLQSLPTNSLGNNALAAQLQMFTCQSTLDSHISQLRNPSSNFQIPSNTPLPT